MDPHIDIAVYGVIFIAFIRHLINDFTLRRSD